jgi:hypothetical protein
MHHTAGMGRSFIQEAKESASLIDHPHWPRKDGPPLRTGYGNQRIYKDPLKS